MRTQAEATRVTAVSLTSQPQRTLPPPTAETFLMLARTGRPAQPDFPPPRAGDSIRASPGWGRGLGGVGGGAGSGQDQAGRAGGGDGAVAERDEAGFAAGQVEDGTGGGT